MQKDVLKMEALQMPKYKGKLFSLKSIGSIHRNQGLRDLSVTKEQLTDDCNKLAFLTHKEKTLKKC